MKRKQLILNIFANSISVLITLGISFILTPYIVRNIGKEAYSFVPISNNFVSYMAILTMALTSMTARFVTLKIHGNDLESANSYYSTSFYSNIFVGLISAVIFVFVLIFLSRIVNVPTVIYEDVWLLFLFIFATFIVNVSTAVYSVSAFCQNRLDISGIISIVASFSRVLVIYILFRFFPPKVYFVGVSVFVFVVITSLMNYVTSKKIMPQLKISFKNFQKKIVFELFSSGVWNSFMQLSNVLMTGLDLLIANILLGPSAAGVLAVAKTAPMAIQYLGNVVPSAFLPHLTILYARESRKTFLDELIYTLKFSAILTGIPIAGFIVLSSQFFALWVPTVASTELTILAILTMISLVANFLVVTLTYSFTITNKLKWPAVSIFAVGILNIIIVLILIRTTNLGLFALAGVSGTLELIRCFVFIPIYAAHCLNVKKLYFYPIILKTLAYLTILIITYTIIAGFVEISSWYMLLLIVGVMGLFGAMIGILFMLDRNEKSRILKIIVNSLKTLKIH